MFAALPGAHGHGARFIHEAHEAGATAVFTDLEGLPAARTCGLPAVLSTCPRGQLGALAASIYDTGTRRPRLLGVTGTNGKTTTVHVLDALLGALGLSAGHSSTASRRSDTTTVASRLTSPEAPELHALLARMREDGVDGVVFDVVGFTNLSHDHMDEFGDMASYLAAKLRLFDRSRSRRGVVLVDTAEGRTVADRAEVPVVTISSRPGIPADWALRVTDLTPDGTRFTLSGPGGAAITTSIPLIGEHMSRDCALALVMLIEAGHDVGELNRAVDHGIPVTVPGRSLLVSSSDGPRFYLDFSHTPDSIEKTVEALREITDGRVIVILGGDGERDPSKREPMGRAAADGADVVIVTDHHPRFEEPARIRRALVDGARRPHHAAVLEIAEPAQAVRAAVGLAETGDTVLWVGPGDTDYRVVQGEDVQYSPRRDARLALDEAGWAG